MSCYMCTCQVYMLVEIIMCKGQLQCHVHMSCMQVRGKCIRFKISGVSVRYNYQVQVKGMFVTRNCQV